MLNLLDENGRTRLIATLAEDGGPTVAFYEDNGKPCASLNSNESGSRLILESSNQLLCYAFAEKIGAGILVTDESQNARSALTFIHGKAGLTLNNDEIPSDAEKGKTSQSEVRK